MGMGHCYSRCTERGSNKILIQPVSVNWLSLNNVHQRNSKNRIQRNSLITNNNHRSIWSEEELKKLYTMDHIPAGEVARIMGRSLYSVQHKRRERVRKAWAQKS